MNKYSNGLVTLWMVIVRLSKPILKSMIHVSILLKENYNKEDLIITNCHMFTD